MAKTPPRSNSSAPAPSGPSWAACLVIATLSGVIGALLTYAWLAPRLARPAEISASSPAPAPLAPSEPSATVPAVAGPATPPANLTAGQSPAEADRTLGDFHYDHGDWAQAAKFYESAIRLGADDPDIRTDLGNAYRFSNRADDALAQYRTAQRLNPQHEFSLFNQGGLFLEQFKDPAQAVEIWNEYLRRFPNGRSAGAARELIARVQGGSGATPVPAGAAPPAKPPAAPADATEARLMQLVNAHGH